MTELLERAIQRVRGLPAARQDEIARALLEVATDWEEDEDIEPAALPGVLEGLADADAGRIATAAEIEAAYKRFEK